MSRHRFFATAPLPDTAGTVVLPLSSADVHHAVRVLRVRPGEEVDIAEPSGRIWRVRVTSADGEVMLAERLCEVKAERESHVTLVFGVSKGSKNDDIIEGAVEVGVAETWPVFTARSVVRLDAEKRIERGQRLRRVASAAAKQSKRASVPLVADPRDLADVLLLLAQFDLVLVAWEEASGLGFREAIALAPIPPDARVAVVVGPEGGLSAEEVAQLVGAGAVVCTLGATILRAETAGVVATALVVHELGGLGNAR